MSEPVVPVCVRGPVPSGALHGLKAGKCGEVLLQPALQ
jgi:hypothetical protein